MRDVEQPLLIVHGQLDTQVAPSNADSSGAAGAHAPPRVRRGRPGSRRQPPAGSRQPPARSDEYGTLTDRTVSPAVTSAHRRLAAEDDARRRPLTLPMWILHTAESEAGPVTFRVPPGADQDRRPRAARRFHPRAALVSRLHCRLEAGRRSARGRRPRQHQRHLRQRQARRAGAADERRPPADRPRRAEGREGVERLARRPSQTGRLQPSDFRNGLRPPFRADRRRRAMARVHAGVVSKREQHGPDRRDERRVIAAGQIGPPDRSGKQRVADEEVLAGAPASIQSAGRHRRDSGPACDAASPRSRRSG